MYHDGKGIRLTTYADQSVNYNENIIIDSNGTAHRIDYLNENQKFGKGGNSSVFKVLNSDGSSDKVVKFSNLSRPYKGGSSRYRRRFGRFILEIEALKKLKDENVQNIVTIVEDGSQDIDGKEYPFYIMEKADTDLTDYVINNHPNIDIQTKLTLFYEIVKALKSLHDKEYYHRDIKPDNIFMFKEGEGEESKYVWKVGDLGLVAERSKNSDEIGEKIGPFGWLSPEAMNKYLTEEKGLGFDCEIDFKSDVFQLGKLLWFIVQGNVPIGQLIEDDLINGQPVKKQLYDLIFEMLRYNKSQRIELALIIEELDSIKNVVPF